MSLSSHCMESKCNVCLKPLSSGSLVSCLVWHTGNICQWCGFEAQCQWFSDWRVKEGDWEGGWKYLSGLRRESGLRSAGLEERRCWDQMDRKGKDEPGWGWRGMCETRLNELPFLWSGLEEVAVPDIPLATERPGLVAPLLFRRA